MPSESQMLITGRSGFIGSNFPNVIQSLDLRKPYFKEDLVGIKSIIHLVGLAHCKCTAKEAIDVNVDLAVGLVRTAARAGVKRFVYLSTMNVSWDELLELDSSPITHSKKIAEVRLAQLCKDLSIELVVVRSPLVYGTHTPGNLGAMFRVSRKLRLTPFGMLDAKRNFISVDNLIEFLLLCAKHPKAANSTFSVSDSETVNLKEFVDLCSSNFGLRIFHIPVPKFAFVLLGRILRKEKLVNQFVVDMRVDSSLAKDRLGWHPSYTMIQSLSLVEKGKL
ncbi:TPA: NAD-dependent epimerase/dehydratase family protein [Vibrio cholerae]|nr:NAD-dependent epimerase/dehydratase family protein [Vibrio cholerae]